MRLHLALLATLLLAAAPATPVTVHLAGDSTMAAKRPQKRPETGWGELLQPAFDSARVRVVNHAQNGRSTRTFIAEGRWQAIVDSLRAGDWVFIQFGHNDQSKAKADRYTPPDDFRANLERMVRDARAKGANPVLLTPVMRRRFDSAGTFRDAHGEYPDLTRRVARELAVPLLDMHRASERMLRAYGPERSRSLFLQLKAGEHPNYPQGVEDNTHFSPAGAELVAGLAVDAIRDAGLELARYLRPGAAQTVGANSAATAAPADCYAELKRSAPRMARTIAVHISPTRERDRLQRPWADSLAGLVAAELRIPDSIDTPFVAHGDGETRNTAETQLATPALNLLVRVEAGQSGSPVATLIASSLDPVLNDALRQAVLRAIDRAGPVKQLRPTDVELLLLPPAGSRRERSMRKSEREGKLVVRPVVERAVPHVRMTTRPRMLPSSPKPAYPTDLKRRGREGQVNVRAIVGGDGRLLPATVLVTEASDPEFEQAVRAVLPGLRFMPAILEGSCAVPTPVQQPFYFRLAR